MSVTPPPIYQPVADPTNGVASLPWILFFNGLFDGDLGTSWTPTFTNLTTTGAPTITGKYFKIGSLVYFWVKIIPSTDTSSTAGTTYINNFPVVMKSDGINFAVSGLLGTNSGMCDQASNKIYVPMWTAITIPLTIIGLVEAS